MNHEFPIPLGGPWYLLPTPKDPPQLCVWYKDLVNEKNGLTIMRQGSGWAGVPDEVKSRAAFWGTLIGLPMLLDLEVLKRNLFKEHYMARHPGLAYYLEWQDARRS